MHPSRVVFAGVSVRGQLMRTQVLRRASKRLYLADPWGIIVGRYIATLFIFLFFFLQTLKTPEDI